MGGFEQANYVVLKMEKGDLGTIRDAVEECKRKGTIGSIILINKNGNVYELTRKSLMSGRYRKILKGEL